MATGAARARKTLLAHSLKHDGAWLDHPWGEDVAKVGDKIFVFFGRDGDELGVGVKLPRSLLFARAQTFVRKFGYGMDRSGWIAARFAPNDSVPIQLLRSWIDESYEAVATSIRPKRRAAGRMTTRPRGRSGHR